MPATAAAAVQRMLQDLDDQAVQVAAADRPDADLASTLIAVAGAEAGTGRHALAANYLLQARTVAATAADRDRLLISALHHRVEARDLAGAARLRQAAEASPPNAARSMALGLLDRETGRIEQARILLAEAVSLAVAAAERESVAQASLELGALHASLNEGEAAVAACARAVRSSRPSVVAQATGAAIGSWEAGRLSEALAEPDTADDARAVEPAEYSAARGMIRYFAGDLRAAREDLGQSMALAHTWRLSVILDRSTSSAASSTSRSGTGTLRRWTRAVRSLWARPVTIPG